MKTVFKVLFRILLFFFLLVLCWAVVLHEEWSTWLVPVLFIGLIASYYLVRLFGYFWHTKVTALLSDLTAKKLISPEETARRGVAGSWNDSLALLTNSSIRRFGNPVYALPWFLVLGKTGTGKTAFIRQSRISTFIKEKLVDSGWQGVPSVQWWYLNTSITLEANGRYVDPEAAASDQSDWATILELLGKARIKEGLSGLIIALEAGSLRTMAPEEIATEALTIRERMEEIIRLFDMRLPVYIVITKIDEVFGLDEWAADLTQNELNQALGHLFEPKEEDLGLGNHAERAIRSISSSLKRLCLQLSSRGAELHPKLLLFPLEIEQLQPGLEKFIRTAFGDSPYLERPFLRGIFLTCAELYASPDSTVVKDLGSLPSDKQPQKTQGLFVRDLFGEILPKDRFLYLPTELVNRWRLVMRNLAGAAWIGLFMAASIFASISYVKTDQEFEKIIDAYPENQVQHPAYVDDQVVVLLAKKQVVDLLIASEQKWQSRWLGFSSSVEQLIVDLKADIVADIRSIIADEPSLLTYNQRLLELQPQSPLYGEGIQAMARKVSIRRARLKGANYEQLAKMPQVGPEVASNLGSELAENLRGAYDEMDLAFIAWLPPDDDVLRSNLADLRGILETMLRTPKGYEWLLVWAEAQPGVHPVQLSEFWAPDSSAKNTTFVRGGLTAEGWKAITGLLNEIQTALSDRPENGLDQATIADWYREQQFSAWRSFAIAFPKGQDYLVTEQEWRNALMRFNTESGPSQKLIRRMKEEFKDLDGVELPHWLLLDREIYQTITDFRETGRLNKASHVITAINDMGKIGIDSIVNGHGSVLRDDIKQRMDSLDYYRKFSDDLDGVIKEAVLGEGKALKLSSDYFGFGVDPNAKDSLLHTANQDLDQLAKASLFESADDNIIWKLLRLPLEITTRYVNEQASCALQKEWEKSVLWKTQLTISPKQLSDYLYGDQGVVWSFVDGPARPFIEQRADTFLPAKVADFSLPFSREFIPYLNRAAGIRVEHLVSNEKAEKIKTASVKFNLENLPVTVNSGSKEKPYAVIFTLQCNSGEIVLNNFNIGSIRSFTWSPEACGDTAVEIRIGQISLIQRYPGPMGFARFVTDFKDGEKRFASSAFPSLKKELDEMGVTMVKVRYKMSGVDEVLRIAEEGRIANRDSGGNVSGFYGIPTFAGVPRQIADCWDAKNDVAVSTKVPELLKRRAHEIEKQIKLPKEKAVQEKPSALKVHPPEVQHHHHHLAHHHHVLHHEPETKAPPQQTKPASITRYFVQVGVFRSKNNVASVTQRLEKIGASVVTEDYDGTGSPIKRVLAGPYKSRESAGVVLNRVTSIGMPGLIVERK